jgi:hypothetical protein
MRIRTVALAIAALVLTVPAGAAVAAQPAQTETELRVYSPSGTVTLTCDPTGGTHPRAKEACAEIDAASGKIAAIPPSGGCLDYWDPVLIGVTGRWRGEEVLFSDFESNPGCAAVSHGQVFQF